MEWFRNWFGSLYEELYAHRSDAEGQAQVDALLGLVGTPEPPVLDIGCGGGRHLRAFAKRGVQAFGLDLSAFLLRRAGGGRAIRADFRHLPFRDGSFGMIASFFTSFGYLETEEEDRALLAGFLRVLRPEGVLFLDLPNPDHVAAHLVARSETVRPRGTIIQERYLENGRVVKRITVREDGLEDRVFWEKVRLYQRSQIEVLAEEFGLTEIGCIGDTDGRPCTESAPRLGLCFRRAA